MYRTNHIHQLQSRMLHAPNAIAWIRGSDEYPEIHGNVRFYQTERGVLVAAELFGLPYAEGECNRGIFGFHIHDGRACTGNAEDPFSDAGTHYNPADCPHPYHAGDLPPLFGVHGSAFSVVLTDRFTVSEIIGRAIIVHASADDFTSQPGGAAGKKIACGLIKSL